MPSVRKPLRLENGKEDTYLDRLFKKLKGRSVSEFFPNPISRKLSFILVIEEPSWISPPALRG